MSRRAPRSKSVVSNRMALARVLHTAAEMASGCSRRRQSAPTSLPRISAPTDVGGHGGYEIFGLEWARIAVRLAGDLAEYPVASAGFRENDGRALFRSRKIGKGEPNYDDLPGCKCAHAASSSGRFQSSAKAASLNSAASLTQGASSRIVTSARRGEVTWTGSISRTSPFLAPVTLAEPVSADPMTKNSSNASWPPAAITLSAGTGPSRARKAFRNKYCR